MADDVTEAPTRGECKEEAFVSAVLLGYPQLLSAVLESDGFPSGRVDAEVADVMQTPLIWAARKGWLSIARLLVEKGRADVHVPSISGLTALMVACSRGHAEVVTFLLEKGADPGMLCSKGKTALMYAAEHGHMRCVHRLLEAGVEVEVDCADKSGKTAFAYACLEGHAEVAWLLVRKGGAYYSLTDEQAAEVRTRGNVDCLEVTKVSGSHNTILCYIPENAL
jgi:ankyrin repeat protein